MPKVDVSRTVLPQNGSEIPCLDVKESDYCYRLDMLWASFECCLTRGTVERKSFETVTIAANVPWLQRRHGEEAVPQSRRPGFAHLIVFV